MTIEELLKSMQNKYNSSNTNNVKDLPNTKSTWERIGLKDSFAELGFANESEKESFLKEWIDNNPYNNI